MTQKYTVLIPADVPEKYHARYAENYNTITHNTGRLFLFACDQKIEHLNQDFYGENIHPEAAHPEHIFNIASQGRIGALATHLGLITRYANQYPTINYLAKLNAKTNLIPSTQDDPYSAQLYTVTDVVELIEQTNIPIKAIGLTLYIGSEHEHAMLEYIAEAIFEAHQHGLVTVLWIYPRGKAITDDASPQISAGAAGVGHALGADFVKIKPPHATNNKTSAENLVLATAAAGNTGVICAGGPLQDPKQFLHELYEQIHIGKTAGCATGRNIFQHSLPQAINMTHAIASIVLDNSDIEDAAKLYML